MLESSLGPDDWVSVSPADAASFVQALVPREPLVLGFLSFSALLDLLDFDPAKVALL